MQIFFAGLDSVAEGPEAAHRIADLGPTKGVRVILAVRPARGQKMTLTPFLAKLTPAITVGEQCDDVGLGEGGGRSRSHSSRASG